METDEFSTRFEALYRETYMRAVRRVRDKRARLSPETTGLLLHLTATGPVTLGELAQHTGRAQSTMSEMVAQMTAKGLLEVDQDPDDHRRRLIWLSETGQDALTEALKVLDPARLAQAADALSLEDRDTFIEIWSRLIGALHDQGERHDG